MCFTNLSFFFKSPESIAFLIETMDGTENKLVATDRAILTTGSLKVIRVFNIESAVKKGKEVHYHNGAIKFRCSGPNPLAAFSYYSKSVTFTTEELALSVRPANQKIVSSCMTIWNNPTGIETQRLFRTNLIEKKLV